MKIAGIAAFASFALATPAMADSIPLTSSSVGQSFTLNYDGYSGGTTVSGLTGSTTFTLTSISPDGKTYNFNYSVTNTSSDPVSGSRISGFAFNTDPNISAASSTGTYSFTTLNSSYPNAIGSVDVCFKGSNTGSCSGGGNGGLTIGQTGTGTLSLSFSSSISSLTLSDFFVRYQSISGVPGISSASGSGTLTSSGGSTTTSTSTGGTSVPEPGMLGLFGGSLAALAWISRRRRPAKQVLRPAIA
jgi:hypothetical protein